MKFDQDLSLKCDMISRCYFGKMNSILGSVVPLAMFHTLKGALGRVGAKMIDISKERSYIILI